MITPLSGHVSAETAYVVDDYPYGFRLRCKIRYWLEYAPKKGFRFWSQTTNPKRAGEVWNKPKASTYCRFGGVMFLNDKGHVGWDGIGEYADVKVCANFLEKYGHTMPAAAVEVLRGWIARKLTYEQAVLDGQVSITITKGKAWVFDGNGLHQTCDKETSETTVCKSDFDAAELTAIGETLRTPENTASQIAKFARTEVA